MLNTKTVITNIRKRAYTIDWRLMAILLLFLNVKLVIKVAAIVLIYISRFDFKFGFRLKHSRLPIFYSGMIAIGTLNWLMSGMITNVNYSLAFLTGVLFWALCILAIHQVKLSVEKNDVAIIHNTIFIFFIINSVFSLFVYLGIIIETGHINPYIYQGDYQKYFIGTGDYIKGTTLDTSTTNAVLNAFGIVYYLLRKKYVMVLLCMGILLLTGSNATNLLLCLVLIYLFIFQTNKDQKSMVMVCLLMLITFLVKVSPQNNKYIKTLYQRLSTDIPKEKPVYLNTTSITEMPDSILNNDQRKEKTAQLYIDSLNRLVAINEIKSPDSISITSPAVKFIEKPVIPKDSIHTPRFQHIKDTNAIERNLLKFIDESAGEVPIAASKKQSLHLPGKILSIQQTLDYFKLHPFKLITGTGMGNFSSKLAFRVTAMKIAGGYPHQFSYINKDFKSNHLDLYLFYFTNYDDLHSIANSPNSTYDQLLSEYGITGVLCFVICYIYFFMRRLKIRSYGVPLLLLMAGVFLFDYWFEQLSVVVVFELLLFLNIKEEAAKASHENN